MVKASKLSLFLQGDWEKRIAQKLDHGIEKAHASMERMETPICAQ